MFDVNLTLILLASVVILIGVVLWFGYDEITRMKVRISTMGNQIDGMHRFLQSVAGDSQSRLPGDSQSRAPGSGQTQSGGGGHVIPRPDEMEDDESVFDEMDEADDASADVIIEDVDDEDGAFADVDEESDTFEELPDDVPPAVAAADATASAAAEQATADATADDFVAVKKTGAEPKGPKRKTPNDPPSNYETGHQLVSENDGDTYVVTLRSDGKKRWAKVAATAGSANVAGGAASASSTVAANAAGAEAPVANYVPEQSVLESLE